ncbi:hypothetical protein E2C01_001263 [Portunus trituberculatus]|uniref:Uncharacterized protein n=1 Tax=Portunus trituberculatus TaxID=210409 RepID=A0A5B7CH67_PORTR|nr:hypothetical protein [Portunus trituberculatus]
MKLPLEAVTLVFTMQYYAGVSQSCAYTYGRHTASHDRVAFRLRLGYKYFRNGNDEMQHPEVDT